MRVSAIQKNLKREELSKINLVLQASPLSFTDNKTKTESRDLEL